MAPFEIAMMFSYRLSIVTVALSVTMRPQFAIECLRRLNQQGWVTLGQNFGRKGLTDVSQILTRYERDMGLSYARKIVWTYSCMKLFIFYFIFSIGIT